MNILFILIPVSLCLGTTGLLAFLWTLKQWQYKDPVGDAARILNDTFDRVPATPSLASCADAAESSAQSAGVIAQTLLGQHRCPFNGNIAAY